MVHVGVFLMWSYWTEIVTSGVVGWVGLGFVAAGYLVAILTKGLYGRGDRFSLYKGFFVWVTVLSALFALLCILLVGQG